LGWGWGEIIGSQKYGKVGRYQWLLIMINPITPRTRTFADADGHRMQVSLGT
jgi:hypothetical protein